MKLLIKPMWRGVFQTYLVDFKRKEGGLTYYPPLSAILLIKNVGQKRSFLLHAEIIVLFEFF